MFWTVLYGFCSPRHLQWVTCTKLISVVRQGRIFGTVYDSYKIVLMTLECSEFYVDLVGPKVRPGTHHDKQTRRRREIDRLVTSRYFHARKARWGNCVPSKFLLFWEPVSWVNIGNWVKFFSVKRFISHWLRTGSYKYLWRNWFE